MSLDHDLSIRKKQRPMVFRQLRILAIKDVLAPLFWVVEDLKPADRTARVAALIRQIWVNDYVGSTRREENCRRDAREACYQLQVFLERGPDPFFAEHEVPPLPSLEERQKEVVEE